MGRSSSTPAPLRILAIEPYYGGSHRAFLDGLVGASRHKFHLLTMPARKWKWRMRGSAMWCAERVRQLATPTHFDLIFTCDMLSVADLIALLPAPLAGVPIVCYFHENQLTYPLSPEDARDFQYGFTNVMSCLAATEAWFNSEFHRRTFLSAVEDLLRQMPDCVPAGVPDQIRSKSRVMHPGVDLAGLTPGQPGPIHQPPAILWNHRWEYDKNPDPFFRALLSLSEAGQDFRLIVTGQKFRTWPPIFDEAQSRLARHVDHFGCLDSRKAYLETLRSADVVVSTANHEFFGLAIIEAVAADCFPLLPDRLSYPELIPADLHESVFCEDDEHLRQKLRQFLQAPPTPQVRELLRQTAAEFAWPRRAPDFDAAFEQVVQSHAADGSQT